MRGPRGPREELKSPLSGGGTSHWKKWPGISRCSGAEEGRVVLGLQEGLPGLEFGLWLKSSDVTTAQRTNLFLASAEPRASD